MACLGCLPHKLYVTRGPLQSPEAAGVSRTDYFCARRLLGRRTAKLATIAHGGRRRLYDRAGLRMRPSVVRGTAADPPAPVARHHQRAHVVHDTGAHRARRPGDRGRRSVNFVAKFAQEMGTYQCARIVFSHRVSVNAEPCLERTVTYATARCARASAARRAWRCSVTYRGHTGHAVRGGMSWGFCAARPLMSRER